MQEEDRLNVDKQFPIPAFHYFKEWLSRVELSSIKDWDLPHSESDNTHRCNSNQVRFFVNMNDIIDKILKALKVECIFKTFLKKLLLLIVLFVHVHHYLEKTVEKMFQ